MSANDEPCNRCKVRPRHVRANGNVRTYCGPCHSEMVKASIRKRKARAFLGEATAKIMPTCPTCLERPRVVYPSGRVDGYCRECRNAYSAALHRRKAKRGAQPEPRQARSFIERLRRVFDSAAA